MGLGLTRQIRTPQKGNKPGGNAGFISIHHTDSEKPSISSVTTFWTMIYKIGYLFIV
jgi:hypothetical protein